MSFPFTISDRAISVFVDNKPRLFANTHTSFNKLKDAILEGDWDTVRELSDVKANIAAKTYGRVKILDNEIEVDGRVVSGKLIDRILEMVRLGSDAIGGYVKFLDNLMDNPRECAVDELYEFIEKCDLPITPDGHFLAYRWVNADWKDGWSQSVFQKPADIMTPEELAEYADGVIGGARNEVTTQIVDGVTTISMPRNMVDDVRTNTCSRGLHFCSHSYLPEYKKGTNILVVKINPAHVVSIPEEYALNKGRTEQYQVVSTIDAGEITPWFTDEYEQDDLPDDGIHDLDDLLAYEAIAKESNNTNMANAIRDILSIMGKDTNVSDSQLTFIKGNLADIGITTLFDILDNTNGNPQPIFDALSIEYVEGDNGVPPVVEISNVEVEVETTNDGTATQLTWAVVRKMREAFTLGEQTLTAIANDANVSRRQAARIRDNEAWVEHEIYTPRVYR